MILSKNITQHQLHLVKTQYPILNQATSMKKNSKTEILFPRRGNVVCTSKWSKETATKHI